MFQNVTYGSSTASKAMDVCGVQEDLAWVIDGSDPLFPTHISDVASDGEWLVKALNGYFKQHLSRPYRSICDIVYQGIQDIHQEFLKFPQASDLCDLEMPGACTAIVRMRHDRLFYYVLGSCELRITFHDRTIKSICDMRLQELDARLLEISQDLRRKQRMPLFRAKSFMEHLLVENRVRRNIEGGYFVLGEDPEAVKQGLIGSFPVQDVRSVSLICHDFAQYFNCDKVKRNLDQYLLEQRSHDFVELYESLLAKKAANRDLARYMQEKMVKPSTVVSFDVCASKKITSSLTDAYLTE